MSELRKQLEGLGLTVNTLQGKQGLFECFDYEIPCGRFTGQVVNIALTAPRFPHEPPAGIYVKPGLFPPKSGGAPPEGGIHRRGYPTPEHLYWSRPFSGWQRVERNAKTYLQFINRIFDFE